jgi:hypothetical protein
MHAKPIVVANVEGFWSPFLSLLQHMREDAFIRNGLEVAFAVVDSADKVVPAILDAVAVQNGSPIPSAVVEKL